MQQRDITDQLFQAIENNELVLPTMPEWATKVQRMLDDINVSAGQIISVVTSDPVFTAQLIKIANSAAYSDKPKVDNVTAAVSRLGFKMLRNLIISTTVSKLSVVNKPLIIKKRLAAFWEHSIEVATTSFVLAKSQKHLNPDLALLAGLTHDIGTLPLFLHVERITHSLDDEMLDSLVMKFGAKMGKKLLQAWEFPEELIEVPVTHEDLQHETGGTQANYSDIVTIANLLNRITFKMVNWDNIKAVKRMGIGSDLYREFFDRFDKDLSDAREMLFQN
jgi:HD-like signal output (HDOD) protein